VTTTFSEAEGLTIPEDVIARTALHELTHLAGGHQYAALGEVTIGDLDEGGHCSEMPCILNSGAGNSREEVERNILDRPLRTCCAGCIETWEYTKSSPLWTSKDMLLGSDNPLMASDHQETS
jgi:hypothetical protein